MVAGWNDIAANSPLAGDWNTYFQEQVPSTGWWTNTPSPFAYNQGTKISERFDYDPGVPGGTYTPVSSMGFEMITGGIDNWLAREHPELFDFTAGWQQGGVAGVGTVAQDPGFGQFSRTPEVYNEIQAAASKYGVPSNFLQAIIAAESSGDWAGNNWVSNNRPNSGPLLPYVGVYRDAATSRGLGDLFDRSYGNRALQIELLAGILRSQYDQIRQQNPQWGWSNVASYHYSGKPDPYAQPWSDEFQNMSNIDYMEKVTNWWKDLDSKAGNTWSDYTSTGQGTGVGSPNSREWANVNQWDQAIAGAAQKYGVPANLIKAVMRLESNGDPNAVSPQGATGLMQVMPFHVGGDRSVLLDPMQNIDVGTRILMDNYRSYGSWEMAAQAYLGLGGADAHGTTSTVYWRRVKEYWDELNAADSGMFGGPPMQGTPSSQAEAIWGGIGVSINQEHASTGFARQHPDWYEYSLDVVGYLSHPGTDVGMPHGTPLWSPVSGTVIRAGHTGSYESERGGMGELRIRTDSGHDLILGHMHDINVRVGDRVTPGTPVGTSGTANGPHLHLEYRIPNASFNGGWEAIDPFQALGGVFTGQHQGARTGLGYTQPLTFQALMRAGASGQPIPDGPVYSMGGGRSSWNSWLRQAMQGGVPYGSGGSPSYQYIYNPPPDPRGPGGGVDTNPNDPFNI